MRRMKCGLRRLKRVVRGLLFFKASIQEMDVRYDDVGGYG